MSMYRVLIADDEMIERKVLYKTLTENLGDQCTIFQAENGREALRVYEEEKIQIAILDIEMPGINGIEAAQKIREQDGDCCIIFLTAFDEFAYARSAITVRALDYLLKPYDEQELMLVLEEAMRLTEARMGEKAVKEQMADLPPRRPEAARKLPIWPDVAEAARSLPGMRERISAASACPEWQKSSTNISMRITCLIYPCRTWPG